MTSPTCKPACAAALSFATLFRTIPPTCLLTQNAEKSLPGRLTKLAPIQPPVNAGRALCLLFTGALKLRVQEIARNEAFLTPN